MRESRALEGPGEFVVAHRFRFLTLLALVACASPLELPAPPAAVTVTAFAPAEGFAGDRIHLTGAGFGADPAALRVRFGASGPVVPLDGGDTGLDVRVPDDATAGDVVVESSLGRASLAGFQFAGLGRLRFGREALRRDVRGQVDTAFPLAGGLFVFDHEHYDQAAIVGGTSPRSLGLAHVVAAKPWNGGAVVLDDDGECEAHLTVVAADGTARTFAVDRNPVVCAEFAGFAVDPEGTALLVTDDAFAVPVDLGTEEADAPLTGGEVGIGEFEGPVVALDAGRFFVATLTGVVPVTRDGDGWKFGEDVPVHDDSLDFSVDLAAGNGHLAVLADTGRIAFFDARTWPPSREGIARLGLAWESNALTSLAGRLAMSADATRLAVSQDAAGQVTTWDLEHLQPLGSAPVEEPRGVVMGEHGLTYVGAKGGVAVTSQLTGAFVQLVDVTGDLALPQLRTVPADGKFQLVVELVSARFDRVLRYDAHTLQPFDPEPMARLPAGARVDGVVATESGKDLVIGRDRHLFHARGKEIGFDDAVFALPGIGGYLLQTSEDGTLAFVTDEHLDVLDLEHWTGRAAATIDIESRHGSFGDASWVLVLDTAHVRVFDRAKLLAGDTTPAHDVPLPKDWEALEAAYSRGKLLVTLASTTTEALRSFAIVDAATGTVVRGGPFPSVLHWDVALSPSARHAYWLSRGADSPRLEGAGFDFDAVTLGPSDAPLPLPDFTSGLRLFDRGEHAILFEGGHETLVLRE